MHQVCDFINPYLSEMIQFNALCFLTLVSFGAMAQSGPPKVEGIGVVGFSESDSVRMSPTAQASDERFAYYVHSKWPEMNGQKVWGQHVVTCLADSAEWFKVTVHEYQVTPEGDYVEALPYVTYIRKSGWVEFQSWNDYMRSKFIYSIAASVAYFTQPNEQVPYACDQRDCITVTDMAGDWMQVNTLQGDDCSEFGVHCLDHVWFKWKDTEGNLLVRLMPFY